jgi:hypothetical protein
VNDSHLRLGLRHEVVLARAAGQSISTHLTRGGKPGAIVVWYASTLDRSLMTEQTGLKEPTKANTHTVLWMSKSLAEARGQLKPCRCGVLKAVECSPSLDEFCWRLESLCSGVESRWGTIL